MRKLYIIYFNKHHTLLLTIFPKLPDVIKIGYYRTQEFYINLIKVVEGTDLEKEDVYQRWKEKINIY